jgi:hypothetical protein
VAFQLLEHPELDYQATAEALWGPGLDAYTAKNRVNAHVSRLRQLGVARSLGSNKFDIDASKLVELSKMSVPSKPP